MYIHLFHGFIEDSMYIHLFHGFIEDSMYIHLFHGFIEDSMYIHLFHGFIEDSMYIHLYHLFHGRYINHGFFMDFPMSSAFHWFDWDGPPRPRPGRGPCAGSCRRAGPSPWFFNVGPVKSWTSPLETDFKLQKMYDQYAFIWIYRRKVRK